MLEAEQISNKRNPVKATLSACYCWSLTSPLFNLNNLRLDKTGKKIHPEKKTLTDLL